MRVLVVMAAFGIASPTFAGQEAFHIAGPARPLKPGETHEFRIEPRPATDLIGWTATMDGITESFFPPYRAPYVVSPGGARITLTAVIYGEGSDPSAPMTHGASKLNGGFWGNTSDRRVKKDIRPFDEGLQKILLFDPVTYKYNGKGGTTDNGIDYIGVIAQDVKKIMPELVISQFKKLNPEDTEEQEILSHDLSPLIFIFINAFKELNDRVEKLEKSKKNAKPKTGSSSRTDN